MLVQAPTAHAALVRCCRMLWRDDSAGRAARRRWTSLQLSRTSWWLCEPPAVEQLFLSQRFLVRQSAIKETLPEKGNNYNSAVGCPNDTSLHLRQREEWLFKQRQKNGLLVNASQNFKKYQLFSPHGFSAPRAVCFANIIIFFIFIYLVIQILIP